MVDFIPQNLFWGILIDIHPMSIKLRFWFDHWNLFYLVKLMETIPEDAVARQKMLLEMQGREVEQKEKTSDEERYQWRKGIGHNRQQYK